MTLNHPSKFCSYSRMPQAEGGWASPFSLPIVLRGWRPGLGCNIHSCPAFSTGSLCAARPPLIIFIRLVPSIHQLCHPWGALIMGKSHTTFFFIAVLGARHSQCLFTVPLHSFQLPQWVKSFWGLLTPSPAALLCGGDLILCLSEPAGPCRGGAATAAGWGTRGWMDVEVVRVRPP